MPTVKQIAVVDLAHPAASLGTIRLSVLDSTTAYTAVPLGPTGLKIAANGKMFMILTNTTLNRDQAVEVDLTTGAQRIRTDAGALNYFSAYWVQYMDRTPDRSRIYCGALSGRVDDLFRRWRKHYDRSILGPGDAGASSDPGQREPNVHCAQRPVGVGIRQLCRVESDAGGPALVRRLRSAHRIA
jgi:hypothetical protein